MAEHLHVREVYRRCRESQERSWHRRDQGRSYARLRVLGTLGWFMFLVAVVFVILALL